MIRALKNIFSRKAAQATDVTAAKPVQPCVQIVNVPEFENLIVNNLKILKPDGSGDVLVDFDSYVFRPGDRVQIEGPSGCGKSSILRVIKDPNLWEFGSSGKIIKPENAESMFIPSSSYLPNVTLRQLVCGDKDAGAYPGDQVAEALAKAGLSQFIPFIDDETKKRDFWKHLSDGQKKRLAIAGILLQKPAILQLDEITSALDPKSELELYTLLIRELPKTIMLSIVHREGIRHLHNVFATVANGKVAYERIAENQAPLYPPTMGSISPVI